jgi:peptidoglycan/LPS O-acetylase OafA/YrhL
MSVALQHPTSAPQTALGPPQDARTARSGQTSKGSQPGFRPEVQGLRAVAILLVVLYHCRVISGGYVGVDVFFVISGFLITRQLVRELERTGSISLCGFYARRARRILPAASVTTVATVVATGLPVPEQRSSPVLAVRIPRSSGATRYVLCLAAR